MVFIVCAFIVWRIATILISFFAQKTIPYLGDFPYRELISEYHLPSWIASFGNFDGLHYAMISQSGYFQNDQAFFPLYPLFIRLTAYLFPVKNAFFAPYNSILSGILISSIFFLIGLIMFQKYLSTIQKKGVSFPFWVILFFLLFPTSFFFGAVYTEGLFFFLVSFFLYLLSKKKYGLAVVIAILASSTRLVGVFLILPFFFQLVHDKHVALKPFSIKKTRYMFFLLSPLIGLVLYSLYLGVFFGDPLFFINAQKAFNANRSTHPIILPQVYYRYFKILLTASHDFRWYLSILEVGLFSFVFAILSFDFIKIYKSLRSPSAHLGGVQRLGLNLFSFANLVLPTLTGTFSSIPRYALFSFSFFITLGEIKNNTLKISLLLIFGILQIALLSLFIQGYFIG